MGGAASTHRPAVATQSAKERRRRSASQLEALLSGLSAFPEWSEHRTTTTIVSWDQDGSLDLGGCQNLSALPSLNGCSTIRSLTLAYNPRLISLPDLSHCANLEELNMEGCSLFKSLPASIGQCVRLKTLDLSHCVALKGLPPSLGNCIALAQLNLGNCDALVALPDTLEQCAALSSLDVSQPATTHFPLAMY